MANSFNRAQEDVGNIVSLEHVNLGIPDQRLATIFYVSGLGLTRDPYLMTGVDIMWVNTGASQFHLMTCAPQRLGGSIGVVIPGRESLLRRLNGVKDQLAGTHFGFAEFDDYVEVICPWGNRLRCHEPSTEFGSLTLGIPYVQFDVPTGTAPGIARFYEHYLHAPSVVEERSGGQIARVHAGTNQRILFTETSGPLAAGEDCHIQIYLSDFSGPYERLKKDGLVSEESNQHQYRFKSIVDPESHRELFNIEHEVRSMRHPLFARKLVNRNPDQTAAGYVPGFDDVTPVSPPTMRKSSRPETA